MRLIKAHITNFRSIGDSTEFDIGDVTCLVGKNEAGKTAILSALYKLKPIIDSDGVFDATDDYPRRSVTDYQDEVAAGAIEHATAIKATYALEDEDIQLVQGIYGENCFNADKPIVALSKDYDNKRSFSELPMDRSKSLQNLVEKQELSETLKVSLLEDLTPSSMIIKLNEAENTEAVTTLLTNLKPIAENGLEHTVYNNLLASRIPKFLYFDDYFQMNGQANLEALKQRINTDQLEPSDHPLLGLIALARLDINQLLGGGRTEALLAKLEAAENQLTQKVLSFWSQNKHLRMKFDIRPAQSEDPTGMTSGTNIWGRVQDTKHMVSTPLGTRSRGFVWFFSFLAWYSQIQKKNENIILLLDEPGLSLHAKAQDDLLKYFNNELAPSHQVIYTTHSPFMVDPTRFDRVRVVQDLSLEDNDDLPVEKQGTRVLSDILEASEDSLFPLQGALGYELYQTLFVGPNCLVVEGVSDLLYLQAISGFLHSKGKESLSDEWTITPVGGSDKVSTFVAMIGAKKHLNVAVLIDFQKKDKQSIENIYKKKLLEKKKVLTYADFVPSEEADVEDLFNPGFYLKLFNGEYGTNISVSDLPNVSARIIVKLNKYLETNPLNNSQSFNHFRPARFFSSNLSTLEKDLTAPQLDRFEEIFKTLNGLL